MSNMERLSQINSIAEQRNNLLEINNDLVFGVYELVKNEEGILETKLVEDALTCYKNQYEDGNIKGLAENTDISILDLKEYMSGNIVYLRKGKKDINIPKDKVCYISIGAHEIVIPSTDKKFNIHYTVTERDSGANDKGMYTTVAGRGIGVNALEETIREYIEERVWIIKDKKSGKLTFKVPDFTYTGISKEELIETLKTSINNFIERKIGNLEKPDINTYESIIVFEKRFGFSYNELIALLKEFKENGNINVEFFNITDLTEKVKDKFKDNELGKNIKKVVISGNDNGYFHVVYDERTGGYECKKILFNYGNGCPLGQIFTESKNQRPKIVNSQCVLSNDKGYVPYFVDFVRQLVDTEKEMKELLKETAENLSKNFKS